MFQQTQSPTGAAGLIAVRHVDEATGRVVQLARFGFDSEADLQAAWDAIPQASSETFFVAVRDHGEGTVEDRHVTGPWIASRTGRSLEDLLREGLRQRAATTRLAA